MPPGVYTLLVDRLREEMQEARDADAIRQQAAQLRFAGRHNYFLTSSSIQLGLNYERQRLENPNLRPDTFAAGVREGRFHVGPQQFQPEADTPVFDAPQPPQARLRGAQTALGGPEQAQQFTEELRGGIVPEVQGPQREAIVENRGAELRALDTVLQKRGMSLAGFDQLRQAFANTQFEDDSPKEVQDLFKRWVDLSQDVADETKSILEAEQPPPEEQEPAAEVDARGPGGGPLGIGAITPPRTGGITGQTSAIERATAPAEALTKAGVEFGIKPLTTPLSEQAGVGEDIEKVPFFGESLRRSVGNLTTPALAPLLAAAPAAFIGGEAAATLTGSTARAVGASPGQVTAAELAGDVLVGGGIEAGGARLLRSGLKNAIPTPGQQIDEVLDTLKRQAQPTGGGEVGEVLSDARALAAPTRATSDIAGTVARVGDDVQPTTRDLGRILHGGDEPSPRAATETVARQAEPPAPAVERSVDELTQDIARPRETGTTRLRVNGEEVVPRAVPAAAEPTARTSARLPRNLQRSSPRFGRNELDFASDTDKALYTVADGVKRSKADDQFMQFLRANFPDASDSTIRASGKELKDTIKAAPKTAGETLAVPDSQIVPGRVVPRSAPPASGTPEFAAQSGVSETQLRAAVKNKDLPAHVRKSAQEHLNKVCK